MANPYQDALFESMEYLLKDRVNKLDRDKTITATITLCVNALTGEYKVNYNNGFITAYAAEGTSYSPNQSVYVLVPEGDFTKKKIIIGKASSLAGDNNITFVSSMLNDYNVIGDNVISDKNNMYPIGLHSYLKEDYLVLYDKDLVNDKDAKVKILSLDVDKLNNYIKEAEAIMIEATFQTRLPKEHRSAKEGIYGIQFLLAFQDQAEPTKERLYTYTLDTNNMTGNPFLYQNEMDQYAIFPIDRENFKRIESIMVFSRGFVSEDDPRQDALWGADIFIKDVEFYGLRPIDAQQGDYRLKITTPMGATFKTTSKDETLEAYGLVTYQINEEISDTTSYYWFTKDDRVSSASEGYQMYGGSGWRYLKAKGNTKHLVTNGSENRAYENKYLCVAVYKDMVILKSYFTLYNEAAKRDISIVSNLGVSFCFDRGTPVLTCLVNGKDNGFEEAHPDYLFSFSWSKINKDGSVVTFNRSYEDIKNEYEQLMKTFKEDKTKGDENSNTTLYSTIVKLRNEMAQMEEVKIKGNRGNILEHPVKNISSSVTFSCSVYLKDTDDGNDYFIGNATITLVNEGAAKPSDYYILIENGQQVFQYSESGVSPASERYTDPQEILPLGCKFFDPAGLEINPDTYNVRWRIPIEYTMIDSSEETLSVNPANSVPEYFYGKNYKLKIAENFDYNCVLNQIECIITYKGQEYTRYTDFLFVKVGDNGTNGTDFVCKIVPIFKTTDEDDKNPLNNEPLVLQYDNSGTAILNTGISVSNSGNYFLDPCLEFQLFNRGTRVTDIGLVKWSIAGNQAYTKYLSIKSDEGAISWDMHKVPSVSPKTNLIIKAETNYTISETQQTFYCYYPLPTVYYKDQDIFNISLDKQIHFNEQYRLKQVLYNADGRNPLFDKNQGLVFHIGNGVNTNYYAILSARGGNGDNASDAMFTLSLDRDDNKGTSGNIRVSPDTLTGEFRCYVIPDDVYSGELSNNRIHGEIYTTAGTRVIEFEVPIHFMLNVYGHASLNAWDGNHVEINEDGNYVLAPQIGAGKKNKKNQFTGILMGVAETYTGENTLNGDGHAVGLLGYANGQQSIWLDAETGNATFGLPQGHPQNSVAQLEGRIELRPGGTSTIGSWKLGANTLYNSKVGFNVNKDPDPTIVTIGPSGEYPQWNTPSGANVFIAKDNRGVVLSASPPYLSVKTGPITSGIDTSNSNNLIDSGDSIEIELDPAKMSAITIYRHFLKNSRWTRTALAGINANGEFYSNALQHANTNLGLGFVGGFDKKAGDRYYVGSRLGVSTNTGGTTTNIIKFFVAASTPGAADTSISSTSDLYISGSTLKGNEAQRAIVLLGKQINLETGSISNSTFTGTDRLHIGNDGFYAGKAGNTNSFIDLRQSGESSLKVNGSLTATYEGATTETYNSTLKTDIKSSWTLTVGGTTTGNYNGKVTNTYGNGMKEELSSSSFNVSNASTFEVNAGQISSTNGPYIKYDGAAARIGFSSDLLSIIKNGRSLLLSHGFTINDTNGGILLTTNSSDGIKITTTDQELVIGKGTNSPWKLGHTGVGGSISYNIDSKSVVIEPQLLLHKLTVSAGGSATFNCNTVVGGDFSANGNTQLAHDGGKVLIGGGKNPLTGDILEVRGASHFYQNAQYDKDLSVTGNIRLSDQSTLGVGNSWINSTSIGSGGSIEGKADIFTKGGNIWVDRNHNIGIDGGPWLKETKQRADSAYDLAATKTTESWVKGWVGEQGFAKASDIPSFSTAGRPGLGSYGTITFGKSAIESGTVTCANSGCVNAISLLADAIAGLARVG